VLYRKTTFTGPPTFLCKSQILEEIEESLCEPCVFVVVHPIFVMEKLNKKKLFRNSLTYYLIPNYRVAIL